MCSAEDTFDDDHVFGMMNCRRAEVKIWKRGQKTAD
jgi:hypothetical protein